MELSHVDGNGSPQRIRRRDGPSSSRERTNETWRSRRRGVHFERARLDPELGKVFCLSSAPTKQAVMRVHERAAIRPPRSLSSRWRCGPASVTLPDKGPTPLPRQESAEIVPIAVLMVGLPVHEPAARLDGQGRAAQSLSQRARAREYPPEKACHDRSVILKPCKRLAKSVAVE